MLYVSGGAKCLCKSLPSSRPNKNNQEKNKSCQKELQPQLHGDVGVQDPLGRGQVQNPSGHSVGQQSVPREHFPWFRHLALGENEP